MKIKVENDNVEKVYDIDDEELKDMGITKTNKKVKGVKVNNYNFRGRLCAAMPIIAIAVFFMLGFTGLADWSKAWLVFLSIPAAPVILYAFDGNAKTVIVNFTILASIGVYLALGFTNPDMWGKAWIVFLLIPIVSILVPRTKD